MVYSPQLLGCFELLCDMLLIETPVRKNIMRLLNGEDFINNDYVSRSILDSSEITAILGNLVS